MFSALKMSCLFHVLLKKNQFLWRDYYNILNIYANIQYKIRRVHMNLLKNRDQNCRQKTFEGLKVNCF